MSGITTFAASELHISISAQPLFEIFGFPITNAMVSGAVGVLVTAAILFYVGGKLKRGKYNRFVGLIQWVFAGLVDQIFAVIPNKEIARKITPLAITIFFVVLLNYWMGILPGAESILWNGHSVLRSMTADLNFTLALAVVTMVAVQIYAIRHLGIFGNGARYFRNPLKDPIGAFEGILEVVGEFSRGIALSLRLFGNAFAGEVLLLIIAVLAGYVASLALPIFMGFEIFIGFIQAYVFFMLTIIFTALAVSHSHDDHSPSDEPRAVAASQG